VTGLVVLALTVGAASQSSVCNSSTVSRTAGGALVQQRTKTQKVNVAEGTRESQITVVSYNLYWWNVGLKNHWESLWQRISAQKPFDLIGFQECEDVAGTVQSSGLAGFDHWQGPNKPQSNPAPLAWNAAVFSKVAGPGHVVVGADQYGDRIVTWVRLQHIASEKTVLFANTHGPLGNCGADLGDKWVSAVNDVKSPGDLVILTGDFNCQSGSEAMNKIRSSLTGGIDGGIDFILTDGMETISGGNENGYPSDHPLIKARFQLGSATSGSPPSTSRHAPTACGMQEEGIDYKGGDFKSVPNIVSAEKCAVACRHEPDCQSYSWALNQQVCYLKNSAMPSRTSDSCCISGLPSCSEHLPVPFNPVDGGEGRACRGASADDDSDRYFDLFTVDSLESCMDKCVAEPSCKGIEYNSLGRCEVWKRPDGIQSSEAVSGFTCMSYEPVSP